SDTTSGLAARSAPMPDNPSATLLLVEDDETGRRLTTQILRQAKFEVREAATAGEALRLVDGQTDLIVLDVQLPDMSGFEVCRALKANPATASTLVLHLSGGARSAAGRTCGLEAGADGSRPNPVAPDERIANVTALLRMRRAEGAARGGGGRLRLILDSAYDAFGAIAASGPLTD